jgi:hypothetical protein
MNQQMPGLYPLELSHTLLMRDYLSRYPRENCDYTITNLIVWGKIYNNQYTIWKDSLVFFNPKHQYIYFPLGEDLRHKTCSRWCTLRQYYPRPADFDTIEYLANIRYAYLFRDKRDQSWADYVYSTEKMVNIAEEAGNEKKPDITVCSSISQYKVLR